MQGERALSIYRRRNAAETVKVGSKTARYLPLEWESCLACRYVAEI